MQSSSTPRCSQSGGTAASRTRGGFVYRADEFLLKSPLSYFMVIKPRLQEAVWRKYILHTITFPPYFAVPRGGRFMAYGDCDIIIFTPLPQTHEVCMSTATVNEKFQNNLTRDETVRHALWVGWTALLWALINDLSLKKRVFSCRLNTKKHERSRT